MADNNRKVEIDAAWFAELYSRWKERNEIENKLEDTIVERDELKAKLSTAQNYEAVIAAKEREIAAIEEERNRLNAKVNELKAKLEAEQSTNANIGIVYAMKWKDRLAAAERCIDDVWNCMSPQEIADNEYAHIDIIRAYRAEKDAK